MPMQTSITLGVDHFMAFSLMQLHPKAATSGMPDQQYVGRLPMHWANATKVQLLFAGGQA
jgi:hypothetical protein